MNNKESNYIKLMNDIGSFAHKNHFNDLNETILSPLLRNNHIQRLVSMWLIENNMIQLNNFLEDMPLYLENMANNDQSIAINNIFSRAEFICDLIPKLTDGDFAAHSITPSEQAKIRATILQPWSTLNRPLFEISDNDIQKLQKNALYINGQLLTANTVLDMTDEAHTAFHTRIATIIKEQPSYFLPSSNNKELIPVIYSDKLIDLLKNDPEIIDILGSIRPFHPVVLLRAQDRDESEKLVSNLEENRESQLSQHLGFSDDQADLSDTSEFSDLHHDEVPSESPTFWQIFNLDYLKELSELLRLGKITLKDIPDRALTPEEEAGYQTLFNQTNDSDYSSGTDNTTNESQTSDHDASTVTTASKVVVTPKNLGLFAHRQQFIPVIKDKTHNKYHKERNDTQRKLDPYGDGIPMPWHHEYKKRHSKTSDEKTTLPDLDPSSKNPKRK